MNEITMKPHEPGKPALPFRPTDWESGFHADFSAEMLLKEFSLLKVRFQSHGSHRSFHGHYAYHRPSSLFQEISPPPASASQAQSSAAGSSSPAQNPTAQNPSAQNPSATNRKPGG